MFLFSYATKYGKMPLYQFSAWYNSIGAFTGILVMHFLGEKINLTQSFGVVLLCLGLYIINIKT
jgi:drug/metabolite transporter (DMT)-like permease